MLAGTARIEITPPLGVELMGYGAREGVCVRVADPLFARALFLATEESKSNRILVVSAELCLMGTGQARRLREQIGARTGLAPDSVLIACTHTHSGPVTGLAAESAGESVPEHVEGLMAGIVEAGVAAWSDRQAARLRWLRSSAEIGRNRRVSDGPVDPEISILRVDAVSGRPLAVLFRHACHGTVLGHDNLDVSADWAGVASARIEEETGAIAPFILGAHADIDPRTRGLMDIAIPGQSLGLGHAAVRVLGGEVADAVLAVLDDGVGIDAPIAAACAQIPLTVHLGELSEDAANAKLDARKAEIARLLGVPVAQMPRLSQLWNAADSLLEKLSVEEARDAIARVRGYVRDKTAPFFVGGKRQLDVEIQVLRIGDAALLGLPLEPTTAVGLHWKRLSDAAHIGGVVGIANGWLRYLPHADDLAHPRAHQHYEVVSSLFAADAAEKLLGAADELRRDLFSA